LPTGGVAWLDTPPGRPVAGAVFFHGYHAMGATQPAALAVRRALLADGFLVLTLDAPGFGETPPPAREAPATAWNPLPSELAAYDLLRGRLGSDRIAFVGHSMGTGEVARVLASDRPVRAAAMLGAGFTAGKPVDGPYWYERFNKVVRFEPPIDRARFAEIARLYHDKERAVRGMPQRHAPLLFIEFKWENPDLMQTRDAFYALIPGDKSTALLESSHYFWSERVGPFLVGNIRPTRRLARLLRERLDMNGPAIAGANAS
jgi:pimeloyl-ACP methyl ester carboxylesterase